MRVFSTNSRSSLGAAREGPETVPHVDFWGAWSDACWARSTREVFAGRSVVEVHLRPWVGRKQPDVRFGVSRPRQRHDLACASPSPDNPRELVVVGAQLCASVTAAEKPRTSGRADPEGSGVRAGDPVGNLVDHAECDDTAIRVAKAAQSGRGRMSCSWSQVPATIRHRAWGDAAATNWSTMDVQSSITDVNRAPARRSTWAAVHASVPTPARLLSRTSSAAPTRWA